jgi:hypothetical protein
LDNPFKETSRSHRLFEVLANADRPLRPQEIATNAGEPDAGAAHSMVKDLRSRGIPVHRYRDPNGTGPTASLYSLRPVEGFVELASSSARTRGAKAGTVPVPVRPGVRQPQVGSIARVTALLLNDDKLDARFECDDMTYTGTVRAAQPSVGEWLMVATVGLHGHGLYVDLAGGRVVTVENIAEVDDGR